MGLLIVVSFSYRQTIFAYPSGGGSYVVSQGQPRREARARRRRVAARRLRAHRGGVDLRRRRRHHLRRRRTCARTGSSSASPSSPSSPSPTCAASRSRAPCSPSRPTSTSSPSARLIVWGFVPRLRRRPRAAGAGRRSATTSSPTASFSAGTLGGVTFFLLMRAFSSGAVALTGVEAISNGVPAFRPPESRNAAKTLIAMALILGVYFFCISVLAHRIQPTLSEDETILSLLGDAVFGDGTRSCTTCSRSPRWRSWSSRPTPPSPTSPASLRSSPATATCPASSATVATGWCSPTASSPSPSSPPC